MESAIKMIIRKNDFSISEDELNQKTSLICSNIDNHRYDYGTHKKTVLTQKTHVGKKKRIVYSFEKDTTEFILCEYLKLKLDNSFELRYSDRKKIIKILFNTLPVINDLNDFVIVRFDFRSFFDSVSTEFIREKFIKKSMMKRSDKDLFAEFCSSFQYCFAGLQTSNAMTEIACKDFDNLLKARMNENGIVYYERYVDDALIILNSYISEIEFLEQINACISEVFVNCKVAINTKKFIYISRRQINLQKQFDFLGYLFTLKPDPNGKLSFEFGITESKICKYTGKIRQTLLSFKESNDIELLRHRMKLSSSRVVYSLLLKDERVCWVTKGLIENYNELRFHIENLDMRTKSFLQNVYYDEMRKLGIHCPYFMPRTFIESENSIYNIYSNIVRNRSLIFDERIGTKFKVLVQEIRKVDPTYYCGEKTYYQVVKDYLDELDV